MSISLSKYVDITSFVGAPIFVSGRRLIARIFTTNELIPTKGFVEFTNLADVATYFGTVSEEYLRASYYFSFISKLGTRPQMISFARWTDQDVPAMIFGSQITQTLTQIQTITNGVFSLTIGATTANIGPINFSTATSFADVATEIETAINAVVNPNFATATVNYNNQKTSFNLVSGVSGVAAISVSTGSGGTNISDIIGWGALAIFSNGNTTETITDTLENSANQSNNFGSFAFTEQAGLTLAEITEAAAWEFSKNVVYMYCVPVATITDATNYYNALQNYGGVGVTYNATPGEFPEMLPMCIMASTDFTRANSVQNYMFYQSALTPSVSDDQTSNLLDSYRVNYYGNTQTAGNQISFYQRGILFGPNSSPLDMNVYANEVWFKDAAAAVILQLLLSKGRVPANRNGRGQILSVLQSVIDQALFNGTISVDKPLTQIQKLFITEITNDPNAWYQVNGIGYWVDCQISEYVNPDNNQTEFQATYLLVYSKDDAIRRVEGTHALI